MDFPILTTLIVLPMAAGIAVLLLPRRRPELALPVSLAASLLPLGAAIWLLVQFETGVAGFQFVEDVAWYEAWGISYKLGVDGISLLLVVLTAFLFPISLLASTAIKDRVHLYMASMLFLEAGIIGVFLSLDLVVFFVFWEVMLVPMYFIIGIWGGKRRVYAAIKFFLFTAFGSALMLAAILVARLRRQGPVGGADVRLHRSARCGPDAERPSSGCLAPSACRSPSRCRCSRCTPGCPTPTSRPRRRVR